MSDVCYGFLLILDIIFCATMTTVCFLQRTRVTFEIIHHAESASYSHFRHAANALQLRESHTS